jgi:hypothetical protein
VIGIIGAVSTTEPIEISIGNIPGLQPIVAGTYSDTSTSFAVEAQYAQNSTSGVSYVGGSNEDGSTIPSGNSAIANHFKVVIASTKGTTIKGTFSGNFTLTAIQRLMIWP